MSAVPGGGAEFAIAIPSCSDCLSEFFNSFCAKYLIDIANFKTLCGAEKRSPCPAYPTFRALPLRVKPLNAGRRRPSAIIFSSSANTFEIGSLSPISKLSAALKNAHRVRLIRPFGLYR
ncbi:MAG: hypothetical protein AB7F32_03880 [Victivallaceae bacterium]